MSIPVELLIGHHNEETNKYDKGAIIEKPINKDPNIRIEGVCSAEINNVLEIKMDSGCIMLNEELDKKNYNLTVEIERKPNDQLKTEMDPAQISDNLDAEHSSIVNNDLGMEVDDCITKKIEDTDEKVCNKILEMGIDDESCVKMNGPDEKVCNKILEMEIDDECCVKMNGEVERKLDESVLSTDIPVEIKPNIAPYAVHSLLNDDKDINNESDNQNYIETDKEVSYENNNIVLENNKLETQMNFKSILEMVDSLKKNNNNNNIPKSLDKLCPVSEGYDEKIFAALGLKRVDKANPPIRDSQKLVKSKRNISGVNRSIKIKKEVKPLLLNNRGLPARIRKKNPLFYDNDLYNVEDIKARRQSPRSNPRTPVKDQTPTKPRTPVSVTPKQPQKQQPLQQSQEKKVKVVKKKEKPPIVIETEDKKKSDAHETATKLKKFLKLPKACNWACCELLYSNVDKHIFNCDNDFVTCLKEAFPDITNYSLTRTEWCMIRRLLGKPRRCSSVFFAEEIKELRRKRAIIRLLQRGKIHALRSINDIPSEITLQPIFGTDISARVYSKQDGLFTGHIDAFDPSNNSFRVTFENQTLGTMSIPDYNVLENEPLPSISKATLLKALYMINKKRKDPPVYIKKLIRELNAKKKNNNTVNKDKPNGQLLIDDSTSSASGQITPCSTPNFTFPLTSPFTSIASSLAVCKPSTSSSSVVTECNSPGETIGKYPLMVIQSIVKMRKLLHQKTYHVNMLEQINTEIERKALYDLETTDNYRIKYANSVVELESINQDIAAAMNIINSYLKTSMPDELGAPILLEDDTATRAKELTDQNNETSPGVFRVEDKQMLQLIYGLATLMYQIQELAQPSNTSFGINILNQTICKIKSGLSAKNKKVFEDCVEIHMKQIQAALKGNRGFLCFDPEES